MKSVPKKGNSVLHCAGLLLEGAPSTCAVYLPPPRAASSLGRLHYEACIILSRSLTTKTTSVPFCLGVCVYTVLPPIIQTVAAMFSHLYMQGIHGRIP